MDNQPPSGQPPYGQYGQQPQFGQQPPQQYGQPQFGQQPPPQQYGQSFPPQQPYVAGDKDWLTTLLLCLFVGWVGAHRFYTGHTVLAILQIVTLGGCGIWTLIDLITIITGSFRDANGRPLYRRA